MQHSGHVPDFISAKNPRALAKLMREIQDTDSVFYPWTNIAQANDGRWYAWYIPKESKA